MKKQLILSFSLVFAFTCCSSNQDKIKDQNSVNKVIDKSSFINYLGQPIQIIDTSEFKKIEHNKICEEDDCWIVTRYYWNDKEWAEIEGDSLVGAINSNSKRCFKNTQYQNIIQDKVLNQIKNHKKVGIEFSAISGYYFDISENNREGVSIYSDCLEEGKFEEEFRQYLETGNNNIKIANCQVNQLRVVKIFER
jgi:uncharacterized protein YcfL